MAAPTVTFRINTGTEGTPTWTTITSGKALYWTGPDTTASVKDPVQAPETGNKVAEEMWVGDYPTYASGVQCTTYDGTVNTNQNVLSIYFATNPTSTAPKLTAWDTSAHSTIVKEALAGTSGSSNTSLIKAVETTAGAPGASWCTITTESAGGASTNALAGNDHYVQCASAATADSAKIFNIVLWIPSDIGAGTTGHDPVLTCQYTYT